MCVQNWRQNRWAKKNVVYKQEEEEKKKRYIYLCIEIVLLEVLIENGKLFECNDECSSNEYNIRNGTNKLMIGVHDESEYTVFTENREKWSSIQ